MDKYNARGYVHESAHQTNASAYTGLHNRQTMAENTSNRSLPLIWAAQVNVKTNVA